MTKAEIIDRVYEEVGGFSKKEAAELVESIFDTMKDVLTQGEKIKLSGFGNFVVREKETTHRSQSSDRFTDSDQRETCAHLQTQPSSKIRSQSPSWPRRRRYFGWWRFWIECTITPEAQ